MKHCFFLIILFFMNCSWGQDPFDKTQRTRSQFDNAQTVMEQTEITSYVERMKIAKRLKFL